MIRSVDVLVLGAGPAGSTIARLLAAKGRSVLLLKGSDSRNPHAGTLPPAINELFAELGIQDDIARASYYPALGQTRWWGNSAPVIEEYRDESRGYHVARHDLDELLVRLAERAGAVVERNRRAPTVDLDTGLVGYDGGSIRALFVVDATGRNGLVARQIRRVWDPRYRTMGLCGLVRSLDPWPADPHHSLVEAYDRGWAWSVPLSPHRRYVCLYVDADVARPGEEAFRSELERTVEFRRLFAGSELEAPPWLRDASLYYSERCAGENWMLVGDAGSFVDTLTSFGIDKAIASAAAGAAAIDEVLRNPSCRREAIGAYCVRESDIWEAQARRAAAMYAAALDWFDTPFWRARSKAIAD